MTGGAQSEMEQKTTAGNLANSSRAQSEIAAWANFSPSSPALEYIHCSVALVARKMMQCGCRASSGHIIGLPLVSLGCADFGQEISRERGGAKLVRLNQANELLHARNFIIR